MKQFLPSTSELQVCSNFQHTGLVESLVHKLVHRKSKTGKLKESSKNSSNMQKTNFFKSRSVEIVKMVFFRHQQIRGKIFPLLLRPWKSQGCQKSSLSQEQGSSWCAKGVVHLSCWVFSQKRANFTVEVEKSDSFFL